LASWLAAQGKASHAPHALAMPTPQNRAPWEAFMAGSLSGRTLFISGASRGIGLAIALRAARDGANIIVAAKSTTAHPKLPGTIYEAATAIERAGGQALPLAVDIREEAQVAAAVQAGVARFGGIDCLVNNASAISLTGALETPMKRFDLMMSVNLRGTYLCSQACLPHLLGAPNPHILTLSPPLNFDPRWFRGHPAYTISKYAMSLCVLGLAAEFADRGVAVNGLWPKTVIATAALNVIPGMDPRRARRPEIVADAAWQILVGDAKSCTGNLFTDEEVLAAAGETDFDRYNMDPAQRPFPDLFVD
jgi:citronellol/citronellal dehydrogenase